MRRWIIGGGALAVLTWGIVWATIEPFGEGFCEAAGAAQPQNQMKAGCDTLIGLTIAVGRDPDGAASAYRAGERSTTRQAPADVVTRYYEEHAAEFPPDVDSGSALAIVRLACAYMNEGLAAGDAGFEAMRVNGLVRDGGDGMAAVDDVRVLNLAAFVGRAMNNICPGSL